MRLKSLVLVTAYAFAAITSAPHQSFAQSQYGLAVADDTHRVLTIPRHRQTQGVLPVVGCGVTYDCRSSRPTLYEPDPVDPSDPFDSCISGCDIDVIYRALTGRPSRQW